MSRVSFQRGGVFEQIGNRCWIRERRSQIARLSSFFAELGNGDRCF
jgi:hypothetical protein